MSGLNQRFAKPPYGINMYRGFKSVLLRSIVRGVAQPGWSVAPSAPRPEVHKMYYTYILFSESINKYYVGNTEDLTDRLKRHNAGEGKFTKRGVPWNLKCSFKCNTRSEAIILENKIKKRGVKRFLQDMIVRGVAQPG